MILRTVQKSELTVAVNYLPDFLKDAFVLGKEFCVTNLVNFEQINLLRVTSYCSKSPVSGSGASGFEGGLFSI